MEHGPEAVSLDGDGRFNRGEAESLPTAFGRNQARLHERENAQNKGKITPAVSETLH